MLGIRRWPCPGAQDFVIACLLAFGAEVGSGNPCQRIEPVDRTRGLRKCLNPEIATAHVCQLVEQNAAATLRIPPEGRRRQQHGSPREARNDRAATAWEHTDIDGSDDAELFAERVDFEAPFPWRRLRASCCERGQEPPDGEPCGDDQRTGEPCEG